MKIRLGGIEYEAKLDARKFIQIEKDTGKSFSANATDPGMTFICSAIAAAISTEKKHPTTHDVAGQIDMTQFAYYGQCVATLMDEALNEVKSVKDNVSILRKK